MDHEKQYYLSVLGVFKNESHILEEWIQHYLQQGFCHIFLVNDHSTDTFLPIIDKYAAKVTLYNNEVVEEKCGRQEKIYNRYGQEACKKSVWVAVLDLDEFLYSPIFQNIKSFFLDCQLNKIGQVLVDWVHFGSSHFIEQPPSVIQHFMYRMDFATFREKKYYGIKSIAQSSCLKQFRIHEHEMIPNTNTLHVGWTNPKNQTLLINHYAIQSLSFWLNVKAKRGDVNRYITAHDRNMEVFREQDNNDVYDDRLAKIQRKK